MELRVRIFRDLMTILKYLIIVESKKEVKIKEKHCIFSFNKLRHVIKECMIVKRSRNKGNNNNNWKRR